ncbi:MAG: DnaJ domain-containing protein [Myxococcota bacterium]
MSTLDQLDYYTLLGVEETAERGEIKRAFKRFAKKYHPDRHAGTAEKAEKAAAIYRRGSEAYQVLTEPEARKRYDEALAAGRLRLTAEELDRAFRGEPPVPVPKKRAQPIKSPQALALFKESVQAANQKDWRRCWRSLKDALDVEPDNEFLRERFTKLDRKLRDRL